MKPGMARAEPRDCAVIWQYVHTVDGPVGKQVVHVVRGLPRWGRERIVPAAGA